MQDKLLAPTTPFPGRPEEENALFVASRGLLEVPQASSCSRAAQQQGLARKISGKRDYVANRCAVSWCVRCRAATRGLGLWVALFVLSDANRKVAALLKASETQGAK